LAGVYEIGSNFVPLDVLLALFLMGKSATWFVGLQEKRIVKVVELA
jgi:hypothetical protein